MTVKRAPWPLRARGHGPAGPYVNPVLLAANSKTPIFSSKTWLANHLLPIRTTATKTWLAEKAVSQLFYKPPDWAGSGIYYTLLVILQRNGSFEWHQWGFKKINSRKIRKLYIMVQSNYISMRPIQIDPVSGY